jgi:hypothetical protein
VSFLSLSRKLVMPVPLSFVVISFQSRKYVFSGNPWACSCRFP